MKRIIVHWTAGSHTPSAIDREHYHFLIDCDGDIYEARPVSQNNRSVAGLTSDDYAAHTRALNSYSIGVALCAMHGARERPFHAGNYPITQAQVRSLSRLLARLAREYGIPVERDTILTHAEVQPTLGVWQRGKWDVVWWPGMAGPVDAVDAGDRMRGWVREVLDEGEGATAHYLQSLRRAIQQELRTHTARMEKIIREAFDG